MANSVVPYEAQHNLLDLILAANGSDNMEVHLFNDDITPTVDTVLSDFNEVDITGYAAQGWDWTPATTSTGKVFVHPTTLTFGPYLSGSSQLAYGFYVTDGGGTRLINCGRFAAPVDVFVDAAAVFLTFDVYDPHHP